MRVRRREQGGKTGSRREKGGIIGAGKPGLVVTGFNRINEVGPQVALA